MVTPPRTCTRSGRYGAFEGFMGASLAASSAYSPPDPWLSILLRSTKAGAETPATRGGRPWFANARLALNEGRGRDPGDTADRSNLIVSYQDAQRRPGPRPRRHP